MLVQGGEGWLANYLSTLSPALRTLCFPPPHACTHPNEDIPSFCKKTFTEICNFKASRSAKKWQDEK